MIIEGGKHGNASNLARYLLRDPDNAQVLELRGSVTNDLAAALTDWEIAAKAMGKGRKVLYHSYLRVRDDERLFRNQWLMAVEKLEASLGLTGCSRLVVAHDEGARGVHVHVVWSRLKEPGEPLVSMRNDRRQFHEVARWAEREFGLTPVSSSPGETKTLRNRDIRALKSRGMDKDQSRKIVLKAWSTTTDGQGFRAELDKHNVLLLKGDRRDYVIDVEGLKLNPVRLLPGVTAAEFRERMQGLEVISETPPAQQLRGRKAKNMAMEQVNRNLANDEVKKPPKRGWKKLKPREDDVGIGY